MSAFPTDGEDSPVTVARDSAVITAHQPSAGLTHAVLVALIICCPIIKLTDLTWSVSCDIPRRELILRRLQPDSRPRG